MALKSKVVGIPYHRGNLYFQYSGLYSWNFHNLCSKKVCFYDTNPLLSLVHVKKYPFLAKFDENFYVVNFHYLCSKTKFVGPNFLINKKVACVNI